MGIPLRETPQLIYLSRIKEIRHHVHHNVMQMMHMMEGKVELFLFFLRFSTKSL